MDIETLRSYCLSKKQVTESFPFDKNTLVFKVAGKMFALIPLERWEEGDPSINLKCNPQRSLELREQYLGIYSGYHMNKTHWNTVRINLDVPEELLLELVDHSYQLVVDKLPGKTKAAFGF